MNRKLSFLIGLFATEEDNITGIVIEKYGNGNNQIIVIANNL